MRVVNRYKDNSKTKEEREITGLDFGVMPHILPAEYLDVYKGIQSEIVNTTYMGKSDKTGNDILKVEESFPLSEHGYTLGRLLDWCQKFMKMWT